MQVYLRQVRGLFSAPFATSNQSYLSAYLNDSWAINRRVTINAGLRWEEEQLNGPNQQYVFVDNWSPRLGINIDPFADRKTKIYFNWSRYTQALPTDAAIRVLNQELDLNGARWAAPSDGRNLVTNPRRYDHSDPRRGSPAERDHKVCQLSHLTRTGLQYLG